jgi:hypothetical protein
MKISICINSDTRSGFEEEQSQATGLFSGCKSKDFLTEGVLNKIIFFEGFEKEVILFVDEHNKVPAELVAQIKEMVDTLVIRKHTGGHHFNDKNYLAALRLCTGDVIAHFDQDCAAFTESKEGVEKIISWLNEWKYVSYPSHWSPKPVDDKSFNYVWCSTRFFICKRETIDFAEIEKCLNDYDYFCDTYKPSRICHWTEHIIGLSAGSSVYYPPLQNPFTIFCWNNYKTGTLKHLNELPYNEVINFINQNGGLHYPADLTLR